MLDKQHALEILVTVARVNPSREALTLWAQLVGYPPCPKCDYCLPNCRCPKSGDQLPLFKDL